MNPKTFLSGLEEVTARFLSLIISIIFFVIYMLARESITVEWQGMVQVLGLFWIVYEVVAYVLFSMFRYFGDKRPPRDGIGIPVEEIVIPDIKTNGRNAPEPVAINSPHSNEV